MVNNLKFLFGPINSFLSFILKYIDKFLKVLKTDRNTFLTYILTLLTVYLVVDRIVEILLLIFTGISRSYWGPIQYTLAILCPVFAFLFSGSSKYADSKKIKLSFFYVYIISLYILIISMITQWVNLSCWLALLSVPNYHIIATDFSDLIKPAFSALALFFPLTTFYKPIHWLITTVDDTKDLKDSIGDYAGINLSDTSTGTGPYTCEIAICKDTDSGKSIKIPESKRFESTLVVGVSGSGKTSMIYEPMIARDIDKKFFFKELSKEMAFTALKTGIATLKYPYTNDYINQNFNLNMLKPNSSKMQLYQAFMKKLILNTNKDSITYRNLGITYISPDFESISHILDVADNYKMPVNLIDPNDINSPGLNPFIFNSPLSISTAISTVLKGLYAANLKTIDMAYVEVMSTQAIENLAILLKVMYPRLHDGDLPNLEDMMECLNDFSLVESLCEKMKEDEELRQEYKLLLSFFKKNFYENSSGKADMEKYVSAATSQLEILLRYPGVKNILCKRSGNIDFDRALDNGEITLVCTRRGDLGANAHKAFGLFFILLMQYSVLKRPGNENSRIPHFLYIDEFSDFICGSTEALFTLYRKYRVASVVSVQSLDQLNVEKGKYKRTILANCANKIVFGNNSPEDNEWWQKELGEKREWDWSTSYDTTKGSYDPKLGGIKYKWKPNYMAGKVQSLKFKNCMYKVKNMKGKSVVGTGKLDFLESKYKEPKTVKEYRFDKFTSGIAEEDKIKRPKKKKSTITGFSDTDTGEIDPIQTDTSDSSYFTNNEDAIIFDLKKGNPN